MNIKSLVTTSVIAMISASAAQAADVIVPRETASAVIAAAPSFSWTGFYIGGQVGNFSSKTKVTVSDTDREFSTKDNTPRPSGFMGGIYAGSNVDLGNGLVLGVETDAVWADREESKKFRSFTLTNTQAETFNNALEKAKVNLEGLQRFEAGDKITEMHSYREKWSGATRVRIGFTTFDRIMPYVAGGIAYAQVQGIQSVSGSRLNVMPSGSNNANNAGDAGDAGDAGNTVSQKMSIQRNLNNGNNINLTGGTWANDTKTMVGFTVGGGVDFAMTDNILLRAEYRYSDFGKKKFADDAHEFEYKTNDFRVGVAYKF
ncbi:outer membrane immunogenic protein [Bartonella fuyuanensis]|uniref:Porin n=1 Tax=Bartonella fuyuanensis TaxID=1460968 RepID=A0A840DXZ7_9HYPH|nr:outer membrane protein [Bartonella fuyuanensis]MBB4076543.1 outer membrane immunogenic protein [Bartonella fuyuanensis]